MCYVKEGPERGLRGDQQTANHFNRRDRTAAGVIRAGLEALPAIIRARGERASRRFIEFFTANIRNRNTRMAYARAVKQFFDWCEDAAWSSKRSGRSPSRPTSSSSAPRPASRPSSSTWPPSGKLFDYLTTGGILASNPAVRCAGPNTWSSAARPGALGRGGPQAAGLNRDEP